MIVHTMHPDEIQKELEADLLEIVMYVTKLDSKYRRAVIKARNFPFYFSPIYRRAKSGNNWIILFEAASKKDKNDSKVTFVCYFNTDHGYYAVMPTSTSGKFHFIFYQPHFFSRYAQRHGSDLHGKDLIAQYFKKNYSYIFEIKEKLVGSTDSVYEVYGSSLHGVAMGIAINSGNIFFRTFVSYEMLKGEQVETYTSNENIRKEIHENI